MKAGALTYFTGLECKRGHLSDRYTISAGCRACLVANEAARRAAFREKRDRIERAERERALARLRP